MRRIQKNDALQVLVDVRLVLSCQLHHIRHIYLCPLRQGDCQRLRRRVHMGDNAALLDGPFREHIRLADEIALIVQDLKGGQEEESVVRIES